MALSFFGARSRCSAGSSPALLGGMLLSVLSGLAQGGINMAPQALIPKFDRMNPANRIGQIFSPVGLSNLLKSLLHSGAILWIAMTGLRANWLNIVHASSLGLRVFSAFMVPWCLPSPGKQAWF